MKEFKFTQAHKEKFEEDGFLALEGFLSETECDKLRGECMKIVDEMNPEEHNTVFSTDKHEQMESNYLLTSNDKIRFFWEKEALDENGKLCLPKHQALNKMGHALHILSDPFREVTFSEKMQSIFKALDFVKPAIPQSMYIFKPAKIGGEVNRHIDATFLYSDPLKLVGVWLALEDATLNNGCMWFVPGSHKQCDVTYRMVMNPVEGARPATVFEGNMKHHDFDDYKAVPVKKGTLVLIHGMVHHRSNRNTSESSRNIYTFHVTETNDSKWSERNWLQPANGTKFPLLYEDSNATS
ncbi:phytanoyl-CoA dioxygenase domain-containing protein 1 [Ciona intestinalis]